MIPNPLATREKVVVRFGAVLAESDIVAKDGGGGATLWRVRWYAGGVGREPILVTISVRSRYTMSA